MSFNHFTDILKQSASTPTTTQTSTLTEAVETITGAVETITGAVETTGTPSPTPTTIAAPTPIPSPDDFFMLANKRADGECIQKIKTGRDGDKWDAFQSRPCNTTEPHQQIQLIGSDNVFSLKTSDNNYYTVTGTSSNNWSDVRALWENDRSGSNSGMDQHGWFSIQGTGQNSGKIGKDALINGPIKIYSTFYNTKRLHMEDVNPNNGERLRNFDNKDSGIDNESQTFINYSLYQKCKERNISFDNCTKTLLDDCSASVNQNFITAKECPREYCTKSTNVSKKECKNFCNENKGACDAAATEYCGINSNKDNQFCNCFGDFPETKNSKALKDNNILLTRICNLPECATNDNSYKTQSMLSKVCPSQQVCIQGIETGNIGLAASFKNLEFTCNNTMSDSPLDPPRGFNPNITQDREYDEDDEDKKERKKRTDFTPYLFVAILVLAFLFFLFK